MDRSEKLLIFKESLGGGVDDDFATGILEACDWNVESAINMVMDGDMVPRQASSGGGGGGGGMPPMMEEEPRAPMRTGYTDTLMAPITPQERMAQEAERQRQEEERKRQERLRQEHEKKRREEELERQMADQRKEAERQALERRRQKQDAEAADRQREKQQRLALEEAERKQTEAHEQGERRLLELEQQQRTAAEAAKQEAAAQEAAANVAACVAAATAAAEAPAEEVAAPARGKTASMSSTKSTGSSLNTVADPVAMTLMTLRRRYKDTDKAGLATCLQTLQKYISNLASNPSEVKFQRINCQNQAFQTRVAAFEGAVDVLSACGFSTAEDGESLVVGPEFLKSKGSRLFDALTKINVLVDQLK